MNNYKYKTKSDTGKYITGEITAEDRILAIKAITKNDEAVISLKEKKKRTKHGVNFLASLQKINIYTILSFFTQFSFLIRVGIPLFQSLEMVIIQEKDEQLSKILLELKKKLAEGVSFSNAMKKYPHVFSNLHINMIVVGESSGKLSNALDRLVSMVTEELDLKKQIKGTLIYPVVMLSISALVVVGMLTFVFPKFSGIFSKAGIDLPITTEILMVMSEYLMNHFPLILTGIATIAALVFFSIKSKTGKYYLDRAIFKIPVLNEIIKNIVVADFSRSLGALLSSGVSLVRALEICHEITTNSRVSESIQGLIKEVKEGNKMGAYFEKDDIYPTLFVQLITIGEKSAQLDMMATHLYEYYKKNVTESLKKFTSLIEPLMMLVMGGVVTVMAVSLFLPMFKLSGAGRK